MGLIQFDQKRIVQPRYADRLAANWKPDFLWVADSPDRLSVPFGLKANVFTGKRVQHGAGVAYSHNGTSTYSNWVFPANRASAYPYVIGASFIVGNTSAANQTAFGIGGSVSASGIYAGVGQNTATTVDSWGRADIAGQAWEITGPTAVVGKLYNVVRVYREQSQTHMMFVNGVAYVGDTSNTKSATGSWKNVSAGVSVRDTNPIFYGAQTVRLGFVGFSDPGDEWLRAWSVDPLRLFAPKRIWVPMVSAGGGGAITIDATTGNAVAAGVTGVAGVAATINGVVGNATAAGITGTVSVDLSIAGVVGNAVAAGVTGAPAVGISIDGVVGNAVAAGVSGVPGVSIEIAGTVGNAVAAGVAGLAEVGGSISIDGVVGNAVAAGVAGSPGVAITITGNVGNAVAAGVSGLAAIGILIDGVVGNATAAGVTGGLSLDIVVVGVVGNAAAAGVTGAVSLSGGSGADPADVWAYELAPGVSAGQYVTEIHAMLTTLTGGSVVLPVNVKQVNDKIIYGSGIPGSDVFRVTP